MRSHSYQAFIDFDPSNSGTMGHHLPFDLFLGSRYCRLKINFATYFDQIRLALFLEAFFLEVVVPKVLLIRDSGKKYFDLFYYHFNFIMPSSTHSWVHPSSLNIAIASIVEHLAYFVLAHLILESGIAYFPFVLPQDAIAIILLCFAMRLPAMGLLPSFLVIVDMVTYSNAK